MKRHLDFDRFRKVVTHARSVPHQESKHSERQRDVAWDRARELARQAGMSLEEAITLLERSEAPAAATEPPSADPFRSFFAEELAKRDRARRRAWPQTNIEKVLAAALVGHDVRGQASFWDALPEATQQVIRTAIPWPKTLREALAEEAEWNKVEAERAKIAEGYWLDDAAWIRRSMLQEHLLTEAQTPEDAVARARWIVERRGRDKLHGCELQDALAAMSNDIANLSRQLEEARAAGRSDASSGTRTNKEKRDSVRRILAEPGGSDLSVRELARRAGVSVQGAANIKAQLGEVRVKR